MTPLIAIPAAGASSRMGGTDKLLEPVDGLPLLRRQTLAATATSCPVVVLLRHDDEARRDALDGVNCTVETARNADQGLSATLKCAATLPTAGQPLALLMPDIPGIDTKLITDTITTFNNAGGTMITRPVDPKNRPGFPVIFPHDGLKRFDTLTGDRGLALKGWLAMKVDDDRATRDLDTPEDWAAWRKSTGTPS